MYRKLKRILAISTFFILILSLNIDLNAQNRTWLNYEVGITVNSYSVNTQLNNLYFQKSTHSIVGGYLEQEINSFLSVELGVNDKFYGFDASYFGNDTLNLISYAQYAQIPLRLRTRFNLLGNKLFLSPHIGLGVLIKSYDNIGTFPKNEEFNIDIKTAFPKVSCLIETGLSLEMILRSWKFAFLATGNYGKKDFMNYSIKNMDTFFSTNGSYIAYQFRIGYAISNLWNREFWKSKK